LDLRAKKKLRGKESQQSLNVVKKTPRDVEWVGSGLPVRTRGGAFSTECTSEKRELQGKKRGKQTPSVPQKGILEGKRGVAVAEFTSSKTFIRTSQEKVTTKKDLGGKGG